MDALDEAAQMASEPNVWMSIGAAASTAGVQVVKVAGHRRARQLTSASDSRSSPQLTESAVGLVLPWPQPLAYKAWLVGNAGKSSLRQLSLGRAMALVNLLLSSQKLKPRQSECPDLTSVPQGHSVLGKTSRSLGSIPHVGGWSQIVWGNVGSWTEEPGL